MKRGLQDNSYLLIYSQCYSSGTVIGPLGQNGSSSGHHPRPCQQPYRLIADLPDHETLKTTLSRHQTSRENSAFHCSNRSLYFDLKELCLHLLQSSSFLKETLLLIAMDTTSGSMHFVMVPWLAFGHILPFTELASA
jgi:hypothetical protein